MPIIVEPLNQATAQDRQDLQKIYCDAPDWLFAPFSGAAQLIEDCLRDGTLIAGRFNDRLLGAARLQRHQDAWHLSQICVRKITRRRGVAERLVEPKPKKWPRNRACPCACWRLPGIWRRRRWPPS